MATHSGNSIQGPGSRRPLGAVQRAKSLRGQAGVPIQNTPKLGRNAKVGISSGGGARHHLQGHLLLPPRSGQRSCPGRLGSQGKAWAGKKCCDECRDHGGGGLPTNTPRWPPGLITPPHTHHHHHHHHRTQSGLPRLGSATALRVGSLRGARRCTALGPRGRRPPPSTCGA